MKEIIKSIMCRIIYYSGLIKLKSFNLKIIAYHRVHPLYFEEQMNYLNKNYKVISLREAITKINNKEEIKNTVVITFDDGYVNNYLYAYPILKKLNLPATIYVTSEFIDKHKFTWWDKSIHYSLGMEYNNELKKMKIEDMNYIIDQKIKKLNINRREVPLKYHFMNWKQLRKIQDVFEIGGHTIKHQILTNLTLEEAEKEIKQSKKLIENKIRRKIITFAYPNGNYNENIQSIVKKSGYINAVSYNAGNIKDKFALYRKGINENDDLAAFAVKLVGVL